MLVFALWSLAAFVMVGTLITFEAVRQARSRAEELATLHASFVVAVLTPGLQGVDLSGSLPAATIDALDSVVQGQILSDGRDVRVKIWNPNGTVVYSDQHALIGRSFPDEATGLGLVMEGHVSSGVSDLAEAENVFERTLAPKLFQTYVPLVDASGHAFAVAEVYQRYSVIDGDVRGLVRTLSIVFGGGLLFLYAALLPIALSASRTLRERNAKLGEQAAQLGELLEREQQTVAELRELDRMKDDFVAAASHELRTPLTAIIGALRTLEQPALAGDRLTQDELISAARQRAELLFRLVRNLLRGAHLEDAAGELNVQDVDLRTLLESVIHDFPDGPARVRADIEDLGTIRTDGRRLGDILSNLIDNALKFSSADSPVFLTARLDADTLVLDVRDEGIGIEPEHLGSVFERFHQVDQSATRSFGGLGLGLHLVKEMATEMGGRVSVSSALGRGSVFTVSVPLEPAGVRRAS